MCAKTGAVRRCLNGSGTFWADGSPFPKEAKKFEKMSKKVLTKLAADGIMVKLTRESGRHRTLKTIQKQQRKEERQ
ncbi:MAG: hypothetical protein ACI4O7_12510, partial [Aristaeellaceae bacterium]